MGLASAQNAIPISGGFNANVIAGASGSSPQSIDPFNAATLYDTTNTIAPVSGAFPSGSTVTGSSTGDAYLLPAAAANNDLLIGNDSALTGTLTFSTPVMGTTELEVLGLSANGSTTLNYSLIFSGAAAPATGTLTFDDWYEFTSGASGAELSGLGRVNNGGAYDSSHPNQFQVYGEQILVPASDQSLVLTGISFSYSGATGGNVGSIFALSGDGVAVPEPLTWLTLLLSLSFLVFFVRRLHHS